ncbi:MAG: response regulator [Pseudanabaena sp. ELA607]|jgi:twitching motility two-component system response regulator PilH
MATVLVVEDTSSERALIVEYLKSGGHRVIEAADGQEALKLFGECQPHVVITDLVMPGMSGLELCRQLKKNAKGKLPVVACSSKNQELDKLWALKQGIDIYLTKPFNKNDLLNAVANSTIEI